MAQQSGGGGYDISQSNSESSTQGFSKVLGAFQVGGGVRIPEYFWPVLVVVAGLVGYMWLKRK